jgi:hypothetical protein
MLKRLITPTHLDTTPAERDWLDLESLVEVEFTSEDPAHPVESALLPGGGSGWRAAGPGKQTLRLVFAQPQAIKQIRLSFVETAVERTQQYELRWSADGGQSFREIVRQQWNFSPSGTTTETEDHQVNLSGVTLLELDITPSISGGEARASLAQLRIA